MKRKVVETYTGEKAAVAFEVEYRDSQGEWLPAVGLWASNSISVKSSYPTLTGARIAARELNKVCGWHTRVMEAGEET